MIDTQKQFEKKIDKLTYIEDIQISILTQLIFCKLVSITKNNI